AIERALAKNPTDRFSTVSDFVRALAGRAPMLESPLGAALRRRKMVIWGTGIAAVAALYGGIALLRRGAHEGQPARPSATGDSVAPVPCDSDVGTLLMPSLASAVR